MFCHPTIMPIDKEKGSVLNNPGLKPLVIDNNGRIFTTNGCICDQRIIGYHPQEELFPVFGKILIFFKLL
jgi:hypothetical protein